MVRTPSFDKNGMKKGTWTPEEDRQLVAYVTRYGCWNWRQLPKFAGLKRCGKSCRLRWMNYLRPNLKRGNYTKEEEETIIRLHQSMGNKWSTIAAQLPGRTDNEVKNHWHTHLKKRVRSSVLNSNSEQHETSDSIESPDDNLAGDHDDSYRPGPAALTSSSSVVSSDSDLVTGANYSVAESSYNNNNNDNNKNNDDNPFEAYSGFSDDFWTVPFLADDSYVPSDFLVMDSEFSSTELFDADYLSFADGTMYLEHVQVD